MWQIDAYLLTNTIRWVFPVSDIKLLLWNHLRLLSVFFWSLLLIKSRSDEQTYGVLSIAQLVISVSLFCKKRSQMSMLRRCGPNIKPEVYRKEYQKKQCSGFRHRTLFFDFHKDLSLKSPFILLLLLNQQLLLFKLSDKQYSTHIFWKEVGITWNWSQTLPIFVVKLYDFKDSIYIQIAKFIIITSCS